MPNVKAENQMDAEYIEAMMDTPGWKLYMDRLNQAFLAAAGTLRSADESVAVYRAQGVMNGIDAARTIPEILIEEARN